MRLSDENGVPTVAGLRLMFEAKDTVLANEQARQMERERREAAFRESLPEWILCVSLWSPYAQLVVDGLKTIETRTWVLPGPWPRWLVIHASKTVLRAAVKRIGAEAASRTEPRGCYLGIVRVDGVRALRPEDEPKAFFYEPDRYAWELSEARRFSQPIAVARGPQKFVYVPKTAVLAAL